MRLNHAKRKKKLRGCFKTKIHTVKPQLDARRAGPMRMQFYILDQSAHRHGIKFKPCHPLSCLLSSLICATGDFTTAEPDYRLLQGI